MLATGSRFRVRLLRRTVLRSMPMAVRRRLTTRWGESRGVRLFALLTSTDCGVRLTADWINRACTPPLVLLAAGGAPGFYPRGLPGVGSLFLNPRWPAL